MSYLQLLSVTTLLIGLIVARAPAQADPGPSSHRPAVVIDVPGATNTHAMEINEAGQIVGRFTDRAGRMHGFIRATDGRISAIDYPGAGNTQLNGINNAGQVVGTFNSGMPEISPDGRFHAPFGYAHGFLLNPDGTIIEFPVPGARDVQALGINDAGQIVGRFTAVADAPGIYHGFLRDTNGQLSDLDIPGAVATYSARINSSGLIAGSYKTASGHALGYLAGSRQTQLLTINFRGAVDTHIEGLNDLGQSGGWYTDVSGRMHGLFRDANGALSMFDIEGASETMIEGLNTADWIEGWFRDKNGGHGFVVENPSTQQACTVALTTGRATPRSPIVLAADAPEGGLWVQGTQVRFPFQFRRYAAAVADTGNPEQTALRRLILQSMECNRSRIFRFSTVYALRKNIDLREEIVDLMKKAAASGASSASSTSPGLFFLTETNRFILPPDWQVYPDANKAGGQPLSEFVFKFSGRLTAPAAYGTKDVPAHDAIVQLRQSRSYVDCYGGVQLVVLEAVDSVIGGDAFNILHRPSSTPVLNGPPASRTLYGLGTGLVSLSLGYPFTGHPTVDSYVTPASVNSVAQHLLLVRFHVLPDKDHARDPTTGDLVFPDLDQYARSSLAGPIDVSDMVPGDYAYLQNPFDYADVNPRGDYYGENSIYLGHGQFYGLGISGISSEAKMREDLALDYNRAAVAKGKLAIQRGDMSKAVPWTRLASPSIDGRPEEAGEFVPGF